MVCNVIYILYIFLFFSQAQRHITDLYEDLRDGHNLISLLEVLSGETLVSAYVPAVTIPAVTISAVTIPAVTVSAVTVSAVPVS